MKHIYNEYKNSPILSVSSPYILYKYNDLFFNTQNAHEVI